MPEYISIPLSVYQQTREALDAALVEGIRLEVKAKLVKAKADLENVVSQVENCSTMPRQQGFNMLKQLDSVRRMIRKDYGIDEAA